MKKKLEAGLLWLQKYTKTDMLYLFRGGFWTSLSQVVLSGATFLMAISWAHFVSKETYGQYKYVLSIINFLGVLMLSGIGTAVFQSTSAGYEGTIRHAFWQNIKWSFLFFVLALGAAIYYFSKGSQFLGLAILIGGSTWPFITSTNLYSPFLFAKKDFKRSTIYFDIIGNLVPYACLLAVMFLIDKAIWFVSVYFISNLAVGIILYSRVLRLYKPNHQVDKEVTSYGRHLSFIQIINGLTDNLDQIIVFHYLGAVELAVYNFAIAIPDQLKGPMKNLINIMLPKFAERTDAEIKTGMANKIFWLFVGGILLVLAYIILAPFIYHIFFPKYSDAVIYSVVYSISLVSIVSIPATTYLTVRKKIKELYTASAIMSVIQVILMFVGIVTYGLIGLIVSRVVIRIIASLITITLSNLAIAKTI